MHLAEDVSVCQRLGVSHSEAEELDEEGERERARLRNAEAAREAEARKERKRRKAETKQKAKDAQKAAAATSNDDKAAKEPATTVVPFYISLLLGSLPTLSRPAVVSITLFLWLPTRRSVVWSQRHWWGWGLGGLLMELRPTCAGA